MTDEELRNRIQKCFFNLGILLDTQEENFDISEYLEDSIAFVSFIVELESEFDIEIPDDYLVEGKLATYSDVVNLILDEKRNEDEAGTV